MFGNILRLTWSSMDGCCWSTEDGDSDGDGGILCSDAGDNDDGICAAACYW